MQLNFILPCYNEEKILYNSIHYLLKKISNNMRVKKFKITLVDDGSTDQTWNIISKLNIEDSRVKGLKLSKNFGHLSALNAGFKDNDYDYIFMLDADFMLEFPKEIIDETIENMSTQNFDVVQIVRKGYQSSFFKKYTSNLFYLLFNFVSNVKITASAPDFRIINYKVIEKLNSLKYKIFFRREIHSFNFKIKILKTVQKSYENRKSKFTFIKMTSFALESLFFYTGFLKKKNKYIIEKKI